MFKHISRVLAASILLSSATLGVAQAAEQEINFGIISTESSQNLKTTWDPFLADMGAQTGLKINAFFAPDYAGIIQGMRFDKVDVAWYGNKAAMEAVDRAGGEIFAQTVAANGAQGYYSLMVAHQDSPLNSIEDMLKNAQNLTFANGDPNSTSGYLVPGYYVFAQNNVDANKIFKRALNGSHEVNALSVANKQIDVGTFNSEGMERLQVTAPDKAAQLKVIWTSPLIPSDPMVWRKNLDEASKNKLREFFMTYGDKSAEQNVLESLQWAKFKSSDDDQLLPIRQLDLFKKRTEVVNNDKLSDSDKPARLKALDAELAKLAKRLAEIAQKNPTSAG
ncbi:phosphonate ABC transporter substrate-binding protein [Pseudomonas sp. CC6-YY-74]|uniref:phosphonate ABC transporter substrate-binding protein n=1 Tax=Pseudomonas sp. CC6-YY-74 TaxID=1930532 RepID=UPI0009A15ACA|nr:phosphonate ABC transporter substrate-binding protein [Pseudomonas sp. CC6-YY-74]